MESAIVNLRAELHKKKSEANKLTQEEFRFKQRLKPLVRGSPTYKNDSIHKAQDNDDLYTDEEASKLERSRQVLEKKAALYDQLKGGTEVLEDDELNQKFLIDFQEKIYTEVSDAKKEREKKLDAAEVVLDREDSESYKAKDPESYKAKDPSEEWVEYTDALGCTRVCQRKDVEHLKIQMRTQKVEIRESTTAEERKSQIQERWERIDEETSRKRDVHYQDVLYDEARAHGTGFMPFSRDEAERAAQQQFLKDLGSEAKKAAVSKGALNRKRQMMMQARLTKVRQRKRLKMGLPIHDETLKTPPPSDEEEENGEKDEASLETTTASLGTEEKEPVRVREWDLGKPGVMSTLTQEQWIESRRKIRENEFAPPSSYHQGRQPSKFQSRHHQRTCDEGQTSAFAPRTSSSNSNGEGKDEGKQAGGYRSGVEIVPPTSYDYYRPSVTSKRSFSLGTWIDVESAISRGLSQLRKEQDQSAD